jgi:predicted Ser/Thr protein kinase
METLERLGKYQLRGTLGRGAMGVVHDGWDEALARRVAIKTVRLPPDPDPDTAEEIARFRRGAQAAARLSHPNIVPVYEYGEEAGLAYIVMAFVDGPSLKALLDRQERLALPALARVMEGLLAGLGYSHAQGVVHRDIKPANILLAPDGTARIADFGIARIAAGGLTQTGTLLGTPAYMAPEQFLGEAVDARADVYAAGVVLYQLLTGERPFDGSVTAIMHKALHSDPPPPSCLAVTIPPGLDAVVARAMAKRPQDRYRTAEAFAAALRAALAAGPALPQGEATVVLSPLPPPSPPHGGRRRWRRVLLAAGGSAAGAALCGEWLLRSGAPLPVEGPPDALRALLAGAPCAVVRAGRQADGAPDLAGVVGSTAEGALRAQAADRSGGAVPAWHVQTVPPVFCPALDLLRPYALTPSGLMVTLAGGDTTLRDGERILPRLAMPDFPAVLRVDYFGHDGTVLHLTPTAADPPRMAAARQVLTLGADGAGAPAWEAGPPYGTDLIVAIASAAPLALPTDREADATEPAAPYLLALAAAIATARQAGTRVTAALLAVETRAK